jgi:copper oxidase (laccase) domain-containing protein
VKIHCSFTEVTTEHLAKVEVVLARSMYLLDIVKSRHFSYNAEHVYLDLSKCNRSSLCTMEINQIFIINNLFIHLI